MTKVVISFSPLYGLISVSLTGRFSNLIFPVQSADAMAGWINF